MPIDLIFSPDKPNNPFEVARRTLIAALATAPVPALDVSPRRGQFEAVNEHVRGFAKQFDVWLKSVGQEVASNSASDVDAGLFEDVFSGAVDGMATWAIDRCADDVRDAHYAGRSLAMAE